MIANTNDGSGAAPRLRAYMNLLALETMDIGPARFEAIIEAGYDGVQFVEPVTPEDAAACARLGLGIAGHARINSPRQADEQAERLAGEGQECATVHLGWGMEDDDEALRLIGAVLAASARYELPLYVETHRATVFQDNWRTVEFVRRFPELRFNGDFSHWYTGHEMVYGGFEQKLAFIQPVLERVRFLHGRIGDPGCIQVAIDGGEPYVDHFRELWTAAFGGFLGSAAPGDYIVFAPELLAARIYYARTFPDASGNAVEESNRWEQSLILRRIASECFDAATKCR